MVISRLVYRKGVDLLVASAPQICDLFPDVRFVVGESFRFSPPSMSHRLSGAWEAGGDGPKMVDLEQMREKFQLQDRIELLGSIRPSDVRSVGRLPLLLSLFPFPFPFPFSFPRADSRLNGSPRRS